MQETAGKKLKVLLMSVAVLDKGNSAGSTFSNFFEGMQGIELASLYLGYGEPNNDLDMQYFQVNEKLLIKNLLNRKSPPGRRVYKGAGKAEAMNTGEQKWFDILRTVRWQIFFWARELIWKIGRAHSNELKSFVGEFSPDVIMVLADETCYLNRECRKIAKEFNVPVCSFVGDDIYSLRRVSFSPMFWIDRLVKRAALRKLFNMSSRLFVMTDMAKAEFDRNFDTPCTVLTKSLDFDSEPVYMFNKSGSAVRFVYTGNLYAGRWKSLAALGRTLQRLNDEGACTGGKHVELAIYSMTPMTKRMKAALNIPAVKFMGGVPGSEIPAIQSAADVLVHAESMQKKNMLIVRLSFSTKLVDYMHVPRCILAIGPKEQASIDHLIRNDAAVTVTGEDQMYIKVKELVSDPASLEKYAHKAWECGKEHHNRKDVQKRLFDELSAAAEGNKA